VRSALNLPPDKGTGLHEFDDLPTVEAKRDFKLRYREALNALPVDEALIQHELQHLLAPVMQNLVSSEYLRERARAYLEKFYYAETAQNILNIQA
jgi:hypothetical protein